MLGMFRKQFKIGLDIGQDSLKYAILHPDQTTVNQLWKIKLFPEREAKDQILKGDELKKRLTEILKMCQKECRNYSNSVNSVIQGEGTVYGYLELPDLGKKELDVAVPSQAMKYIPFSMESTHLSYVKIPMILPRENKTGVFYVAAQKKFVDDIKNIMEQSGLKLETMDVSVFSLVREFSRNHSLEKDMCYALIHTGFRATYVIVIRNGYPYYIRDLSIGGRDFTYAFQMGEQWSWQDSEKYKLQYDVTSRQVSIEPFLIRWLEEIKKSLTFFSKEFSRASVSVKEIYLSGGTASFKGLDNRLSEHVQLPVHIDTWDLIKATGDAVEYKVSVGAVMKD